MRDGFTVRKRGGGETDRYLMSRRGRVEFTVKEIRRKVLKERREGWVPIHIVFGSVSGTSVGSKNLMLINEL